MSSTEQRSSVTTAEFQVSLMTEHDLLEVVEIEEASGLSRWGWTAYHNEIAEGRGSLMMVARSQGADDMEEGCQEIIGFIAARANGEELHINNVAVRASFRRRGIGGALLESVLRKAARAGARTALLEVRISNTPAQALYQAKGFKIIGQRPAYYTEPIEDAFVMSATI